MIIICIKNGLGNQMFQYAFGKVLEWKYNVEVEYDIMSEDFVSDMQTDMDIFTIGDYRVAKEEDTKVFKPFSVARFRNEKKYISYLYYKLRRMLHPAKLVTEKFPCQYIPTFERLNLSVNYYFLGHWMNLNYFKGYEGSLKKLFELKDKSFYESEIAKEIMNSDYSTVSLHIRRGDYLTSGFIQITELSYYQKAISLIQNKVTNPFLYVFTNDPEWVTTEFRPTLPYKIVTGNSGANSYKDMVLMSMCKHNIIANSSFSWWGAWLNMSQSNLVIYPQQWYPNPKMNQFVEQMFPENWLKI